MPQNAFDKVLVLVSDWFAITPSDTVSFTQGCARGLYVGGAGNVVLISPQGNTMTVAVVAGQFVRDLMFVRVNATGTTATGLVALT